MDSTGSNAPCHAARDAPDGDLRNPTRRIGLGLLVVLAVCLAAGCTQPPPTPSRTADLQVQSGAIVRGPQDRQRLALVFTGHQYAEGGHLILDALADHRLHASFFLTGDFLANPRFAPLVRRIVAEGHYLGPHSDRHLLYCSWDPGHRTLVSRAEFRSDLKQNLDRIQRWGAPMPRFFLPPYEHCNPEVAAWAGELGITLVNLTPGTRSAADYTEDDSPNHVSTQAIFDSIVRRETGDPHGLNGFLLLLHVGAGPRRTDPFAPRFGDLLDFLVHQGYDCVRIDRLLTAATQRADPRARRNRTPKDEL